MSVLTSAHLATDGQYLEMFIHFSVSRRTFYVRLFVWIFQEVLKY